MAKEKTVHKRNKWFSKKVFEVLAPEFVNVLTYDFMEVVIKLVEYGYIKHNVSKYDYYIIRLAKRRGIPLLGKVNDMKDGKTMELFDNNLFTIYKDLGWDKNCDCPYYAKWLKRCLVK